MTEAPPTTTPLPTDRLRPGPCVLFVSVHLLLSLGFVTGARWEWIGLACASYALRTFGVSAGYHRYFSHRAFQTSRGFQLLLAFLAQVSLLKGVLWWASHHRHHHRHADTASDPHSPTRRGFWWSHVGWILARRAVETNGDAIKDYSRFPELVWLDRWHLVPALVTTAALAWAGGLPWVVWGAVVPTVLVWHATLAVNSLAHVFGTRRYLTPDTSRNHALLAVLTGGEGWHNNHHLQPNTANQGWFWWELDLTFYALLFLSWLGVVSDLRRPTEETRYSFQAYSEEQRRQLRARSWFNQPSPTAVQTPPDAPSVQPAGALKS